jgi:hypothetical protein
MPVVTGSDGAGGMGSVGSGIGSSIGTSLGISGVGGWLAMDLSFLNPTLGKAFRAFARETRGGAAGWAVWRQG